jgi:hypothetical protein
MTRDIRNETVHATAELLPLRPDVPGARMWAVALTHTMLTYFEVEPAKRFQNQEDTWHPKIGSAENPSSIYRRRGKGQISY